MRVTQVRIDVGRLVSEVERGRDVGTRKVVGASPDASDPIWDEDVPPRDTAERGYDARVAMRTNLNTEQFVDDALHSEILRYTVCALPRLCRPRAACRTW